MATAFETFVNREIPRRPVLLTAELTAYDGNPNSPGAPDIVQIAPKGTFYLRDGTATLYQKLSSSPGTYQIIGGGLYNRKFNVDLIGTKDGVNKTFTFPDVIEFGSEVIHWNGLRQLRGAGNDYTLEESGGVGTGYDTIVMLAAPIMGEPLVADYVVGS